MAKSKPNPKKPKPKKKRTKTTKKVSKRKAISSSSSSSSSSRSSSSSPSPPPKSRKTDGNNNAPCGDPRVLERIIPTKSLSDPNEYRILKLKNGLTIALVSRRDPVPIDKNGAVTSAPATIPIGSRKLSHGFRQQLFQLRKKFNSKKFKSSYGSGSASPYSIFIPSRRGISSKFNKTCWEQSTNDPADLEEHSNIHIAVSVGSFSDPFAYQGTAHFLEHMLYLGSESFPSVDMFDLETSNFLEFNATTTLDNTFYYLSNIPDLLLEKTTKIFADLIAKPLIPIGMIPKEVLSVDCEYFRKMPTWQLCGHPSFLLKDPKHPFGKVLCGNVEVLMKGGSCNEIKALKKELLEFHKKYYVASAMTVCINSSKSLDELEKLAVENFSKVPEGQRSLMHAVVDGKTPLVKGISCSNADSNKHLYTYIQGEFSRGELHLIWELEIPEELKRNNEAIVAGNILYSLFNENSNGSLKASLYGKGWIFEMAVHVELYKSFSTIQVTFQIFLTKQGRLNCDKIIGEVYAHIVSLKGSSEKDMHCYFDEMRTYCLREFHYGFQDTSADFSTSCILSLQRTPDVENFLSVQSWVDAKFSYQGIISVLTLLLEWEKLSIVEVVPKSIKLEEILQKEKPLEGSDGSAKAKIEIKIDPGMKTKYLTVIKKITTLSASSAPSTSTSNSSCVLQKNNIFPKENEFMKNLPKIKHGCIEIPAPPANFGNISPHFRNFKSKMDPDAGRFLPKISGCHYGKYEVSNDRYSSAIFLNFLSFFQRSKVPRTIVIGYIWARVIYNKLRSKRDHFVTAGYSYAIMPSLEIVIFGFPEFMTIVVEEIINAMFDTTIIQREFDIAKEYVMSGLEEYTSYPEYIIDNIISSLVDPLASSSQDSFDIVGGIEELTLRDLNGAIEAFMFSCACKVELIGNLPVNMFDFIANVLEKKDFGPRLDNDPKIYSGVASTPGKLLPGEKCIRMISKNYPGYLTEVTNVYIIGGINSVEDELCFDVGYAFMKSYIFNCLRTHLQLGYSVYPWKLLVNLGKGSSVVAFSISIGATASRFTACEVDDKIDEFLALYGSKINSMDNCLFETYKKLADTPLPANITKKKVGNWFTAKFGPGFKTIGIEGLQAKKCLVRGIQKLSLQVIPFNNPDANTKRCCCKKCIDIVPECEWVEGKARKPTLKFVKGQGAVRDYFVDSLLKPFT